MPRLIASTGHSLALPARHLTFGEAAECDIPLTGPFGLAPVHFEIAPGEGGLSYIRDVSEGAGTLINGAPVSIAVLREGDVVQAGTLSLRFSALEVPVPPPLTNAPPTPADTPPEVRLPTTGRIVTASDAVPEPDRPSAIENAGPSPAPVVLAPRKRPLTSTPTPMFVRIACCILLLIAAAAFCATDPGQRIISPWISRIHQWQTARNPKPPVAQPPPAAESVSHFTTALPEPADAVIPQTSHEEITRRLLTERTRTYLFADLRQLIPTYNLMASQQGLPSQREMSGAFRKTYGAVIDPFEKFSLLQSDGQDEFLLILTSPGTIDLEKTIGQAVQPLKAGQTEPPVYQLRAGTRPLQAVLYDPFTLLLGSSRSITRAIRPNPAAQLREALSMFPETAFRNPGALIMVKRVNLPVAAGTRAALTAFETIVTNLYLQSSPPSTLSLTRNPEVPEEAFVDAAAPALKEQAAALAPALGAYPAALANISPADINLTLNYASVPLSGGPSLITAALESMAQSFLRTTPGISSIVKAQEAASQFNSARAAGAQEAIKTKSPRQALTLLNEGLRGSGGFTGAMFKIHCPEEEVGNLSSLLAFDDTVGLVYRPNLKTVSDSSQPLAVKAQNYRNAELLIALWEAAGLRSAGRDTPATAARKVLGWADSPAGKGLRSMTGLPSLTAAELASAVKHLTLLKGKLEWKPGEDDYRSWIRTMQPDPHGHAGRIAAAYNAAAAAGGIPASAASDLAAALDLIANGVHGAGAKAETVFQAPPLTAGELAAAGALLSLEDGKMTVSAVPSR